MRQTNLTNESEEYRARREELRLAEIEEMRHRERVAELRRRLSQGAAIEDYICTKRAAERVVQPARSRAGNLYKLRLLNCGDSTFSATWRARMLKATKIQRCRRSHAITTGRCGISTPAIRIWPTMFNQGGIDLLAPVYTMLDLNAGRPRRLARLSYILSCSLKRFVRESSHRAARSFEWSIKLRAQASVSEESCA